ncbi:MAG TPA: ABC transporter ATP-binding protein [Methylomirabilota bacterium]|nr:ABC transporter ATP-binding protein [Methylomirabilota bacterium]
MPQTTIYVAPRLAGTLGTIPPAVATVELARLFGRSAALAGISLTVEMGRTVALLGPNGAGKTTLLRILATAIRPSYGSLSIDGIDALADPELVRGRAVYLSHATAHYDDLTAEENPRFAATMFGWGAAEGLPVVREALATVDLEAVAAQRVRTFSAGMRKRLALARILVARPSLLLLDEPHASLDGEGMALVDRLIGLWKDAGVTIVVASHQAERVASLADATVRLESGLVAEVGGAGVSTAPVGASPRPRAAVAMVDR